LLGPYAWPNSDQDSLEFFARFFADFMLAGNAYWYLRDPHARGEIGEIHLLEPARVEIKPGRDRLVGAYVYRVMGHDYELHPDSVLHFKAYHPASSYYGMSALEAVQVELRSDRSMAVWNEEFFRGPAMPAGILVVEGEINAGERQALEMQLNFKHAGQRRTAIMSGAPGATYWVDAGLKQRELDFNEGRMLSRRAVYETLGLPPGLQSESSTEAHARVAERRMLQHVFNLHVRMARRASRILEYFPGGRQKRCRFEDLRTADWQQKALQLGALGNYMTVDEIRARELGLGPLSEDQNVAAFASTGITRGQSNADRGDARPVHLADVAG
jgi:phage portal protein BeeE